MIAISAHPGLRRKLMTLTEMLQVWQAYDELCRQSREQRWRNIR
jgi:predicted secreted protein